MVSEASNGAVAHIEIAASPEPATGVRLTRKEFELLRVLKENPGKCLSREFLLQTVWGYDKSAHSRTVDVHIARLRRKLEGGEEHIRTAVGEGYFWHA